MKQTTTLLLLSALLFGCITEKKRLEICKSCTLNQITKDSTGVDEVVNTWRDSAIYWKSKQGKTIHVNDCDSLIEQLNNKGSIVSDSNGIKAIIEKKVGSKRGFTFRCESDSLKQVIKLLKQQVKLNHFKTIIKEMPARCQLEHLTKWDSFWIRVGQILSGLIGIAVVGFGVSKWVGIRFR